MFSILKWIFSSKVKKAFIIMEISSFCDDKRCSLALSCSWSWVTLCPHWLTHIIASSLTFLSHCLVTGPGFRFVPEGHCSEWLCHIQLVSELPAPDVHQDPGQEGGLQLQWHCRFGGLSAKEELQGAGGSGYPTCTLPHRFRTGGGWRCGTRWPRDPHAAGVILVTAGSQSLESNHVS